MCIINKRLRLMRRALEEELRRDAERRALIERQNKDVELDGE